MSSPYAAFNDPIIEQFRTQGGRVENFGDALVLLHHVGARTGVERVTPLMALPDGDDAWLIAASKAGAPDNPAWFHNLRAFPDTVIETPAGEVAVHAAVLPPAERDAAWGRFVAASPGFAAYEQRTTRTIPVVRLERRS
jgi:deazaflavin-dependent oxidoreductase (nitroreductase family)